MTINVGIASCTFRITSRYSNPQLQCSPNVMKLIRLSKRPKNLSPSKVRIRFHRHNQMEMTILTRIEATIEATKASSTNTRWEYATGHGTNMEVGVVGSPSVAPSSIKSQGHSQSHRLMGVTVMTVNFDLTFPHPVFQGCLRFYHIKNICKYIPK